MKIGIDLGQVGFREKTWIVTQKPITCIQEYCEKLAQFADTLIRDVDDPLVLQPASLDIATVKRKPNDDTMDFGIGFDSRTLNGTHVIRDVRFQSPAHQCARIHPGDEVVQINYQTVVCRKQFRLFLCYYYKLQFLCLGWMDVEKNHATYGRKPLRAYRDSQKAPSTLVNVWSDLYEAFPYPHPNW